MTRAERAGAYTLHFEGQTAKYVARTHDEFCRLEGALGGGHVRILFDEENRCTGSIDLADDLKDFSDDQRREAE